MKTVGIIGGMGPAATADFYRQIVELTDARRDQDHLHVLIDSHPGVPDRTAFLLGRGADPRPKLLEMAQRLERSGAELLVIPCNSASPFTSDVQKVVDVPIVDWVAETVGGVLAQHGGLLRIGLLATSGTVASGLYQESFADGGVDVLVPAATLQQLVMSVILDVKAGIASHDALRSSIVSVGTRLQRQGAEALLLACTELSLLFRETVPTWSPATYDAARIVAERVVVLAGGRLKESARTGQRAKAREARGPGLGRADVDD